jgi:hypothetical protein
VLVRAEQDAIAAHVDGFAEAKLIHVLPVDYLIADFPLYWKAIRGPAVVSVTFQFHSSPRFHSCPVHGYV